MKLNRWKWNSQRHKAVSARPVEFNHSRCCQFPVFLVEFRHFRATNKPWNSRVRQNRVKTAEYLEYCQNSLTVQIPQFLQKKTTEVCHTFRNLRLKLKVSKMLLVSIFSMRAMIPTKPPLYIKTDPSQSPMSSVFCVYDSHMRLNDDELSARRLVKTNRGTPERNWLPIA